MLTYFSQCQAFDAASGKAYENAGRYTWDAAALKILLKGKFADIDWVNSPSGALALKKLVTGSKFNPVGSDEMYPLLSSLMDEVALFSGKTFSTLGYAVQPKRGLSFEALVPHLKEFVEFANNLAEVERRACL
eukprot:3809165-Pleurochrysis_carterae.AAC.1